MAGGVQSIGRRLRERGYRSYAEYLASPHWQDVRSRFRASKLNKGRCAACRKKGWSELHHRTYKRLGRENLNDLVPLCRPCHQAMHDLLKTSKAEPGQALWDCTREIKRRHKLQRRRKQRELQRLWHQARHYGIKHPRKMGEGDLRAEIAKRKEA